MIGTGLLREFSQLLLKHGASLEDIIGMAYTQEELDPLTGKYKIYFDLTTLAATRSNTHRVTLIKSATNWTCPE
jgi:hypothetical protein